MELKYRFYNGGEKNPYLEGEGAAYKVLTAEIGSAGGVGEKGFGAIAPKMDGWARYVIAKSKRVFWDMERDLRYGGGDTEAAVEEFWNDRGKSYRLGEWLKQVEVEDAERAMGLYMAWLYRRMNPMDVGVDFRLYFTEGESGRVIDGGGSGFSLEPFEE